MRIFGSAPDPQPRGCNSPWAPGTSPGRCGASTRRPPAGSGTCSRGRGFSMGCWELDEDGNVIGGDYHSLIYIYGPDDRGMKYHPDCPDNSGANTRFSTHFGGPWGHDWDAFPTREQAQAWIEQRWAEAERAERERTGLPRKCGWVRVCEQFGAWAGRAVRGRVRAVRCAGR